MLAKGTLFLPFQNHEKIVGVKSAELDANLYETLSAVILDLFIDQEKLAGRPGVEKAKDIAKSLKDLEFDEVLKFF